MIPVYQLNEVDSYIKLLKSQADDPLVAQTVQTIVDDIRTNGDKAVQKYAKQFDKWDNDAFLLADNEIEKLLTVLPQDQKDSLEYAATNIRDFAEKVMDSISNPELQLDGYSIGMHFRPVKSVACYVPGGRYPLPSTALMTGITAQVAGVDDISIFSPSLPPAIVYAGKLAGIKKYYKLGGVQAIAACAIGTESIPRMDMIVGPGNAYVTEAKRQLQGTIGIDLLAGPSEVAIIADAGANPEFIAVDLLAQTEHDPLSRAWLLTTEEDLTFKVLSQVAEMKRELQLPDYIEGSLSNSAIFLLPSISDCVNLSNTLAPEHIQLMLKDSSTAIDSLRNYGSLFDGIDTTVAFGDYAAGINHTLPTTQRSRFSSGLSPLTFLRTQTWMRIEGEATDLKRHTMNLAQLEGLQAHKHSVLLRSRKNIPRI